MLPIRGEDSVQRPLEDAQVRQRDQARRDDSIRRGVERVRMMRVLAREQARARQTAEQRVRELEDQVRRLRDDRRS